MSVSYSGHSCRYDKATGTYSRPAVSIKYPCSSCGANRPLKEGSLAPDQCPCKAASYTDPIQAQAVAIPVRMVLVNSIATPEPDSNLWWLA